MATLRKMLEEHIGDAGLGFKEVGGAVDIKTLLSGRLSTPGCYFCRERNVVGVNQLLNGVMQIRTESISAVICTKNVSDVRGREASDESEFWSGLVENSLLGWEPDGYEAVEYGGGLFIAMLNGLFIWRDSYVTRRIASSV